MRDRPALHAEERIYQVAAADIVLLPAHKYSRFYHARNQQQIYNNDTINNQIDNMNI